MKDKLDACKNVTSIDLTSISEYERYFRLISLFGCKECVRKDACGLFEQVLRTGIK
jgi:hypothetical protein